MDCFHPNLVNCFSKHFKRDFLLNMRVGADADFQTFSLAVFDFWVLSIVMRLVINIF